MWLIASLLLLFSGPLVGQNFGPDEQKRFAKVATMAARTLAEHAQSRPRGCSWVSRTRDQKPRETIDFYTGDSGIVYFLLKTYQLTHGQQVLDLSRRGLKYISTQLHEDLDGRYADPRINGLFEGNAAPASVFLFAYQVTHEAAYLATARKLADRICARPDTGPRGSPDIINGAAGTGLFLLQMAAATGDSRYRAAAIALGDFLIARAEPRGEGVQWKTLGDDDASIEYYFVGFSHGPAGIGYFLEKLFERTGEKRFHDCALKAMRHIERIAIAEGDSVKWYHEELRRSQLFSSQWCHGAPGMNPFFLELAKRTVDPQYREWARRNTNYLEQRGVNVRQNGGVCHGVAGNTAALLLYFGAMGDPTALGAARGGVQLLEETAVRGGKGWTWPGSQMGPDYSYMNGVAGIGDFFIWLASGGKLPMFYGLGYGDDF